MSLWAEHIKERVHAVKVPVEGREWQGHIVHGITACIREHEKSARAGHAQEASRWRQNAEDLLRALERRAAA